MHALPLAIFTMMFTGLFVKMSEWRKLLYRSIREQTGDWRGLLESSALVEISEPFRGLLVARAFGLTYPQAFMILGVLILLCSVCAFAVRFSETDELAARQ